MKTKDLLAEPANRGVRLVALDLLDAAEHAAERLAGGHDEDTLHDFRVAVRRLRSWIRAFKPELAGSVRGRDRRRLRGIGHATNVGRDVDVQLTWLASASRGLNRKRKHGAEWLQEYLTARRELEAGANDIDFLDSFEKVRARLAMRLETIPQPLHGPDVDPPPLARALASRLVPHVNELGTAVAAIRSSADEAEAHQARIAAKRLRYLLEPAAKEVKDGSELLERLKALQDSLGRLHDAHVLGRVVRDALGTSACVEAEQALGTAGRHRSSSLPLAGIASAGYCRRDPSSAARTRKPPRCAKPAKRRASREGFTAEPELPSTMPAPAGCALSILSSSFAAS